MCAGGLLLLPVRVFSVSVPTSVQHELHGGSSSVDSNTSVKDPEKDPNHVFDIVWQSISKKYGEVNLTFPKDIMWLCGAPGSGKGLLQEFIKEQRGITSDPIEVSSLLKAPEFELLKAQGKLVSDRHVVQVLFEALLKSEYRSGVIVDGFPRTPLQGACIKLLYDKMLELRNRYEVTQFFKRFRRPIFHITVLFVEEDVSVERQLKRGREVNAHNKRVLQTGVGELWKVRETDQDPNLAALRYRLFKEEIHASLQTIKHNFHFHFIDADGTVEQVKGRIQKELEYQSSMELADSTFNMIRTFPLSQEIIRNARHELIRRLDSYYTMHKDLFSRVMKVLDEEFVEIIRRQALSGHAIIRSENPILKEKLAVDIILDVLTERGYQVVLDVKKRKEIVNIDPKTFVVNTVDARVYEFQIIFERPPIRKT
jgi:adenylate kinase